ncbi:SDR family oxidoreductase [Lentisalinibacter orientalis]|uniref:SDR family oxidoreductase n=1 Tax=Lentisalinibacter orientalis TaxID=2992241 RepID=UPI00386F42CB
MNLAGRRVLLTGATGGIGAALAAELARAGTHLLLSARDAAKLEALAAELQEQTRAAERRTAILTEPGDITDATARERLARRARGFEGGIDVLINNAGVNALSRFGDQSAADIEALVQTNLLAPMLLTRTLLSHLLARPAAWLLNVGSVLGSIGMPGQAVYSTTKFGLHGFTEALRRECAGTALEVLYLAPRATRTAMNGDAACRMNEELGVAMDPPERVARRAMALLAGSRPEQFIGWPERLFVKLNAVAPRLVDGALGRQRPVVEAYLRPRTHSQ